MIRTSQVLPLLLVCCVGVTGARGDDFTTESAKAAVDRYLEEVAEIDRIASLRREQARARLERLLQGAEAFERATKGGKRYHGMLGSYYDHDGRIPFVMLGVPSGRNVLSQEQRRAFNEGRTTVGRLYKFVSQGHVVIPNDGSYRLEVSRAAGISLNGVRYAVGRTKPGDPPHANVDLTQGVYDVEFRVGDNGGQMNYSKIRIVDNATGRELPIFVYESELEEFTSDLSFGVELIETSRWKPSENEIE